MGKTRLAEEAVALARRAGRHAEWAVATGAAATIPFGALAHLLPVPAGEHLDRAALLQRAAAPGLGTGAPPLLVVDDAHLLDDASAVLVHQLAVRGEVGLVLTVRAGEPAPDPVVALWKDELAARVDVGPLERADVDALAEHALGGAVQRRPLDELWRASRGNALVLREVLQAATDSGALAPGERAWELHRDLGPSARLRELLDARLAGLPETERATAELLAVAEPLEVDVAERALGSTTAAADAPRGVVHERSEGRAVLRLAHPVYGDVLRERLPPERRRWLTRRLADALERIGTRRREDVLRLATWRLESGGPADPKLLVRGAEHALAWADHPLAERLGSAALAAEGRHRVRLALGKAVAWQGPGPRATPTSPAPRSSPTATASWRGRPWRGRRARWCGAGARRRPPRSCAAPPSASPTRTGATSWTPSRR